MTTERRSDEWQLPWEVIEDRAAELGISPEKYLDRCDRYENRVQ